MQRKTLRNNQILKKNIEKSSYFHFQNKYQQNQDMQIVLLWKAGNPDVKYLGIPNFKGVGILSNIVWRFLLFSVWWYNVIKFYVC